MDTFLSFSLGAAMLATLAVLVVGVVSFAVHGRFYVKNANKLMRARVVMQGIALLIFALIMWLAVAPPQL
ncbi:MAG: HIG1 domain-containing protein [Rhodospirillales bacterium]|nr:HIG1 domain-containing protein [Rhodospirillales bacterium]